MKLWKRFGHDFIHFFVNQLNFFVSKHFFKLDVTICDCSKGNFTCFYTYKCQILILTHFNQISRISLKLLCFFYVFLSLLISLFSFCQIAHVNPDIHEKLNIRSYGQFIVREYFIDFVVIFINQFLMMFVFFCEIPDFINGGTWLTNLLPKVEIVEGTHGDFFIKSHKVLVEIIVHHENVIVLLFACVKLFFIISLMPPESVHHKLFRNADFLVWKLKTLMKSIWELFLHH